VKEMREVTSSESAAAALRAIAEQIDPRADIRRPPILSPADDGQHARAGGAVDQTTFQGGPNVADNQEMAGEIVGEAIDLLDQGHATQARALLMALHVRLFCSPRRRPPASRSRRAPRNI